MPISPGNKKMGSIPNVSLPPVLSCGNCSGCKRSCYALKAYKQYPLVRKAWRKNWELLRKDRLKYFSMVSAYLSKHKPKFFRWHVAGDIVDQDYLEWMKNFALLLFPGTKFLTFTKMALDFSDLPKNLTIVYSAWPGQPIVNPHNLPIAFMQDGTETRVTNALECPGNCENCSMCWALPTIGANVVFHKH